MKQYLEEDFMILNLSASDIGILQTIGERGIVANCTLIKGADEADNIWLAEQMKMLYQQYFHRVAEYVKEVQ
jgi:hypothetical protein